MNVFAHVEDRVAAALEALKQDGVLPADLVVPAVEVCGNDRSLCHR